MIRLPSCIFNGAEEIEMMNGGRITYESGPHPSDHYPIIADVMVPRGKWGRNP